MQAEPSKAESPKRKRRWFQFSLRTLMIGVTLLAIACGYVGWQARIVRGREQLSARFDRISLNDEDIPSDWPSWCESRRIPWFRRFLGDKIWHLVFVPGASDEEIAAIRAAFPEADLFTG